MIRTTPTRTTDLLTKAQAKALTDRIRKHIDAAWADITAAYEGKAWKALGYASWEAYVKAEFDMGRSRSYQLLDQGRVIHALADAAGEKVSTMVDISEREAREIKDVLPGVTAEIKARVEQGEDPKKAVDETVAAARAEKERQREERKAQQAEWDRQREEARARLNPDIQRAEAAKARNGSVHAAVAKPSHVLSLEDRIAELEEANRVLEAENAELKAEVKKFSEMRAEWEKGGFEEVVRGKDEVIRAQASRIESESAEKVRNLRSMEWWRQKAFDLGYSSRAVIDLETGEFVDG